MSYRNQSVINSRGGAVTISNTENREYVSINTYSGASQTLNGTGISTFSPNNSQKKIDNDDFEHVGNDKSSFIGGKKFDRINNDYSIIIGDSVAMYTDSYGIWNDKFSQLATANLQPDIKKPVVPILPGASIDQTPPMFGEVGNKNAPNPAITQLQNNLKSGKTLNDIAIPKIDISTKNIPNLTDLGNIAKGLILDKFNDSKKLVTNVISSVKNIPSLSEKLQASSPSTQGGNYEINTAKDTLPDLITETQKELMPIESNLGDGGSMNINVARNARLVVGATVNNNPQATVDFKGRQVPSAIVVSGAGVTTAVAGAPEVNEVDNYSMFPCGTYTLEIGNFFNVKVGGGGINMITSGSVNIVTDTVLKLGALQTIVGGDDVVIKGDKNVSIESSNLNLNSGDQIILNSNVGVSNNIIVNGGAYIDGEVCLNHITAPREIQQTLIGFTKEGARGFLRSGDKITGTILLKNFPDITSSGTTIIIDKTVKFEITLDQQSDLAVELTPHGHEFPNIPLTLSEGNPAGGVSAQGAVRDTAAVMNAPTPSSASGISNTNKYPKTNTDPEAFITNDSSKQVNVTGV